MERIEYILDFCKELGKEMIVSGANIERVNLCIERICHGYGLHDVTCANLTTRISISAKDENKRYAHRQTDVPPQVINLERLKKLNNLSFEVREKLPDVTTLYDLLHSVKTNDFPWWVMMIGFMVAMAALGRIFLAGPAELLVVEINTLLLFGLSKLFTKVHLNKIITNFLSMFLCSTIATLFYMAGFIEHFFTIVLTNAFFLLPGIQMINCARNLLCGNEMNGIIDLLKVILEVCTIIAGVAAVYAIFGGVANYPTMEAYRDALTDFANNTPLYLINIELVVLTLMATAGFSVVFNIQLGDIVFAAIGGVIVRLVYILFKFLLPAYPFIFTMVAAFFAALYSEILAITRKEPSTLYLYPSIVPLIPGDLFCFVAFGIVWQNFDLVSGNGVNLALSLVGISLGFVVCSSVVHYVRKIKFLKLNEDK